MVVTPIEKKQELSTVQHQMAPHNVVQTCVRLSQVTADPLCEAMPYPLLKYRGRACDGWQKQPCSNVWLQATTEQFHAHDKDDQQTNVYSQPYNPQTKIQNDQMEKWEMCQKQFQMPIGRSTLI